MAGRWRRTVGCHSDGVPTFIVGLIIGSFIGLIVRFAVLRCSRPLEYNLSDGFVPRHASLHHVPTAGGAALTVTDQNLVIIGVMTAKVLLETRVIPAYDTWVSSIPGKVIFFSSEGSVLPKRPDIPLVALPGIDDSYPPQRKSLTMIKYLHDHYINKFKFFMRADDDVYIRGDVLGRFLHSINASNRSLYIGQAGLGNKEEFGRLNLKHEDNFCMGGPGVILNRDTLIQTAPHVGYCLRHLLTTHEDVEVGRCIARFAGVSCTWAYEMQKIMYNNYREPKGSFTHSLRDTDIHRAATLHPVKNATYQYRMHEYFLARQSTHLRNQLSRLQRQINDMNGFVQDRDEFYNPNRFGLHPSLVKTMARSRSEVMEWDFLMSHSIYSTRHSNPKRGQEEDLKVGLGDIIRQVMESINRNARQRGRVIDYKDLLYGYRRINPLHGPDYMLDLLLIYRKFKGKHRMTVPVRRHAYLQQSFLEPEFRVATTKPVLPGTSSTRVAVENNVPSSQNVANSPEVRVNFILPLAGRYKTFLQFLVNFEDACFSQESDAASLVVVLFMEGGDVDEIVSRVEVTRVRYPQANVQVIKVPGPFSRGAGLQRGAALFPRDALLFFIDVDIHIESEVLKRIRLNTAVGQSVYYPIVFSQYDPLMIASGPSLARFSSDGGYWREFGYGIVGLYNADFLDVGGFDLEIKGWGREDVDLVERLIARNVSIFRAVDVGLVHIFHTIICDPTLDAAQYQMCLGTKAASFASLNRLASYVRATPEIYRRAESSGVGKRDQVQAQQVALRDHAES